MDVLVTESFPGVAHTAAHELEAAGHRVHRCHDGPGPAFPCAGLTTGCPLDTGAVDLVLAVRSHVRDQPTATEDGVACGLRRRVPVAVAGRTAMHPWEQFGAEPVQGDLVAECERIASSRRPEHEAAAATVARAALAVEGFEVDPDVRVVRVAGRLHVLVTVPVAVPARVRDVVAVRVTGRLRELDPHAGGIDIGVATADGA